MAEVSGECGCHRECRKTLTNRGIRRRIRKTKDETAEAKIGAGGAMRDASLPNRIKVMKQPKGRL